MADARATSDPVLNDDRMVATACRHFGACGGCQLQDREPDFISDWKRNQVRRALQQHGVSDETVLPTADAWASGRRRVEFAALKPRKGALRFGFHRARDKTIEPITECPILTPRLQSCLAGFAAFMDQALTPGEAGDLHVSDLEALDAGDGFDAVITRKRPPGLDDRLDWPDRAEQLHIRRLSYRPSHKQPPETIVAFTEPARTFAAADRVVRIPLIAGGFAQATRDGEAAIASAIGSTLQGCKHVADLFGGSGPITLALLAQDAGRRLSVIDGARSAIVALDTALRAAGLTAQVEASTRDLERRPLSPDELNIHDGAVFDPPRAGAKAQSAMLAQSAVPVVAAVSCHPGTFARDARTLIEGGYRLTRVTPVDQFRWSRAVELTAEFRRS